MRRAGPDLLRIVSIALLLSAIALFFYELVAFSRQRARMPLRLSIAGIPVGGVSQAEAPERMLQAYSSPVELHYGDQIIHLSPASVGFKLDLDVMLAAAELERTGTEFWSAFWDFLWKRTGDLSDVPLRAEFSTSQLERTLQDIGARYDEPPIPAQPIPGSTQFTPGTPGTILDISRAAELVGEVLQSPTNRRVNLPIVAGAAPRPSLPTLEILLKQIIDVEIFDGLSVLFIVDLRTGEEIHFAYFRGQDLPTEPDISFSAASIIKIGVMTAYFRHFDEPLGEEANRWLEEMVTLSGNDPTDWLMGQLDPIRGPLVVTETLQELGLDSTFTAGYYYLGAPLLQSFRTPGNQRTDIDTDPDRYTQTTSSEIGALLGDIYDCSNGGGALMAAFPGEITSDECDRMLDLLSENILGTLIKGGVPEGTRVAHKHGWPSSPFDMLGDAGIVFSPSGDYIISIFLWNDREMIWEPTSKLVADLSRATYNYFNPPIQ